MLIVMLVPPLSVAVGAVKVQGVPSSMVRLVLLLQLSAGGVVSITVTVWLHVALLLQPSSACHTRVAVKVFPQKPVVLVVVLNTLSVAVPLLSVGAGGVSKVQAAPNCTVLLALPLQLSAGGVVSITVTV